MKSSILRDLSSTHCLLAGKLTSQGFDLFTFYNGLRYFPAQNIFTNKLNFTGPVKATFSSFKLPITAKSISALRVSTPNSSFKSEIKAMDFAIESQTYKVYDLLEQLEKEKSKISETLSFEFTNEIMNDSAVHTYLDRLLSQKMPIKELELIKAETSDTTFEEEREHILNLKEVYEEYNQFAS